MYVLVSCMLASAAGWFVYAELGERAKLATLRAEQILQEQQSARASEVRLLMRETQKNRAALFAITGTTGAVEIIDAIDAAAQRARVQVKVESASPGAPHTKDKTLQSYTFSVRAVGTREKVAYFMQLLAALPYPLIVDRFSLNVIDKEWEGFMTFTVYVAPSVGRATTTATTTL